MGIGPTEIWQMCPQRETCVLSVEEKTQQYPKNPGKIPAFIARSRSSIALAKKSR
jgi:hypothetical protein